MDNKLEIKIRFEISQLENLLINASSLLSILKLKDPDFVELSASGSILHSFYNGIENIFVMIEKHYENIPDNSYSWHKKLLEGVQNPAHNRIPIITKTTGNMLAQYLAFRHFFRHAYGFQMDWDKMKHLTSNLPEIWESVKKDLEKFIIN